MTAEDVANAVHARAREDVDGAIQVFDARVREAITELHRNLTLVPSSVQLGQPWAALTCAARAQAIEHRERVLLDALVSRIG